MLNVVLILIGSIFAFAHDGEHGPAGIPAQRGGVMRSLETVNLELVYKDHTVRIYPYESKASSQGGKLGSVDPKKFPVKAKIELPRSKAKPIEVQTTADHWLIAVDGKGLHRFTIVLNIQQGGHEDNIRWTVEPKE